MSPRRPVRHLRLGTPALPSVASWRARNQREAERDRGAGVGRLVCQSRGCHEGLATLKVGTEEARFVLVLAIHAPWLFEEAVDRDVIERIRITGATDQVSDAVYVRVPQPWPRGSRIEIVCRHGHESRFGAGHLAQRLRALLS